MNGDGGWVKVWRKTLESAVWQDPDTFRVWMWCLMKAAHAPNEILVGKQLVRLEAGQFVTGRFKAAEGTGLSEKKVRNALATLEAMQNVAIKRTNKFSIVSIVKWDTYQGQEDEKGQQKGQQRANKGPTKGQQRATNKNEENEKNEKNTELSFDSSVGPSHSDANDCPYETIVEMYHRLCHDLPIVHRLGSTIKANMAARWKERADIRSLEWWEWYFRSVAESDYLSGRVVHKDGRTWCADLSWLVLPTNMDKICTGRYKNKRAKTNRDALYEWAERKKQEMENEAG